MRKRASRRRNISDIFGHGQFLSGIAGSRHPGAADGQPGLDADEPENCRFRWWRPTTVHYIYAEDVEPHDILLCIQTGKKVTDENRMRYEGGQYLCEIRGGDACAVSVCAGST